MMQGLALCDALEEAGFSVLGPFPSAANALAALDKLHVPPAVALLDGQLKDSTAVPITHRLSTIGVPSLITTSHCLHNVPEGLRDASACLSKPFDMAEMLDLLQTIVAAGAPAAHA